jgi:hypothetical protein
MKTPAAALVFLSVWGLVLCAGCAKIAEPQPPRALIPKPAGDLTARQLADSVVITFSMPGENTDGSPVRTLRSVDIYRLVEGPDTGEDPPPMPEAEFLRRAALILSIPESRLPDYRSENSIVIRDELLLPERSLIYSSTFRYGVLLVNKRNQAAGLSNQAAIRPIPIPLAPTALSGEVSEHSINIKWTPPVENMDGSMPARLAGYNIYRSEDPKRLPLAPINAIPVQTPFYEDRNFQFDRTYYYAVSTVGKAENPQAESRVSDIFSIVTRDIFPPDPPADFTAVRDGESVLLLWSPSPSPDVAGYRIARSDDGSAPRPLHGGLIAALSYRDSGAPKTSSYSVIAVDGHGNESRAVETAVDFEE